MGFVEVEEFPYYAYQRYPDGAHRVPLYNSSFPGRWRGGAVPYYDNSMYGGNSAPLHIVEAPSAGDSNLVRKRKLDGLKGELLAPEGANARSFSAQSRSKSTASPSSSAPVRSFAETPTLTPRQVGAIESKQSTGSGVEKSHPHMRVRSIPVVSTDDGKDNIVKCTLIPRGEIKKMRKAPSAEEAAVLIQSWFRGFQVRKTAPLTQLRIIAKVKSQLTEFEEKAFDVDFINYAQENPVSRVKMMEGVMNLLLQLDSIQGAHPVVREIRKLATKQVITLQGRMDALFSTVVTPLEPFKLPTEIKEMSRNSMDREVVTTTELLANDQEATSFVDADEKKEELRDSVVEGANVVHEKCELAVGRDNKTGSDVGSQMAEPELMEFEASRVDVLEEGGANELLPTSMADPDVDQANGEIGTPVSVLEPMEVGAVMPDIIEGTKSIADEMDGVETEGDQPAEAPVHSESALDEPWLKSSGHDDGYKLDEEAAEVTTTVETCVARLNSPDEEAVRSGNVTENSPVDFLRGNQETGMEDIDDRINDSAPPTTRALSEPHDGAVIHPSNAKDPSYSPRSPLEILDYLDAPASMSDSELQPEFQASSETTQDGSTQGKGDDRALLVKLSEENKALKSLLVSVMKWNQMQAATMQDVNQRLGKLESRLSPRIAKKKANSRRREGKSRRMMLF